MKKKITVISVAAALSMLMAVPASVSAAETKNPAGYVVVAAEKFTLGQKFLSEPTKVPFYEGETGADISDRFFGEGNVNNGNPTGQYISAVADKNGTVEADIPAYILDAAKKADTAIENNRTDNAWLSGTDYCSMSGWFYGVNNNFATESISNYKPVDGDVIRMEFSVYGYGADIGMDNSSWGGPALLVTQADRDQLYTVMADVKDKFGSNADAALKTAYDNAYNTASDIEASEDQINKVYEELKTAYENGEIIVTTAVSQVTEPAVTSSSASAVTSVTTPASATKPAVTTSAKSKASPATGDSSSVMSLIIASCAVLAAGIVTRKRNK